MGEDDVIDESPLARAANQLRIPLRERRKGAAAATEVAKSVADDDDRPTRGDDARSWPRSSPVLAR